MWIDRWDRYRLGREPVRSLSGLNVQSGHHKCLGGESPRHSRPYEDASGAPLGGEVIPEPLVDGADLPNQWGLWSRGGFALRSGTSFCGFALRSGPCACQSGKGPSRGVTAAMQSPKGLSALERLLRRAQGTRQDRYANVDPWANLRMSGSEFLVLFSPPGNFHGNW